MAKGYAAAQKYHEENNGMGYTPFNLKKDGESAVVRILQPQTEWENLMIHSAFGKLKGPTRCGAQWMTEANGVESEDLTTCALCVAGVKRSMKTYIPVRVRGDSDESRVQIITYGRNALTEVINQIEELKDEQDMTWFDFKIKRKGSGLDTVYFWLKDGDTKRPLSEVEQKLVIPDINEVVVIPDEGQMKLRAQQVIAAESAAPVEPTNGKPRLPF